MAELVELNSAAHGDLKVIGNSGIRRAADQHVINLRVGEIGKAVGDFPIFATRIAQSGKWALSAMCSFEPNKNLFVEGEEWVALYQPTMMQTYPMFLMNAPDQEKGYCIGVNEQDPSFSRETGESLFDGNGKATIYLSKVTTLLDADIKNDMQTHKFIERLNELKLFNEIDLLVRLEDDSVQTIKGLNTINEDVLQSLSSELLTELHKNGYLAAIYALLISTNQLNGLIRKQNRREGFTNIKGIKLEKAKDATAV